MSEGGPLEVYVLYTAPAEQFRSQGKQVTIWLADLPSQRSKKLTLLGVASKMVTTPQQISDIYTTISDSHDETLQTRLLPRASMSLLPPFPVFPTHQTSHHFVQITGLESF